MVMPVFVAITALLFIVVPAMVLRPLWRVRPAPGAIASAALALAAGLLYLLVGTPAALQPAAASAAMTLDAAIVQLQRDLERDPNQLEGWRLLARAYAEQQQAAKARDAHARAAALAPDEADVQVDYAESRALADPQRRFDAEATTLLRKTLQRDPRHQRARWFLGIAQRQAGQPAAAAATWEPLLAQVDASTAAALRPQLDAARAEAGLPPMAASTSGTQATPATTTPTTATPNTLKVKVELDPDFAARVRLRGDASVFVIARIPDGPPMPVAVEKHRLQDLPLEVTLDDADGPMPTRKLSALKEVELVARLSSSGNAMRQEGDLESAPVRVALPATGVVELVFGK
jgi:cytochrome c-type biogenesis protein CcmH